MTIQRAKELLDLLRAPDPKGREHSPNQAEAECARAFEVRTYDQGDLRGTDLYDAEGWTDAIYCVIPDECSAQSCFVAITKTGRIEMADRKGTCHAPEPERRTLQDLAGDGYGHRPTETQLAGLLVLLCQDRNGVAITPLAKVERDLLHAVLDKHGEDVTMSYMDSVGDFIDENFPEDEGN